MAFVFAALSFFAGVSIRRFFPSADSFAKWLNDFVIYIALPALILRSIPGIALGDNAIIPVLVPWLHFALVYVFVELVGRLRGWSAGLKLALITLIGMGNTAFLGVPLTEALVSYRTDASVSLDSVLATAILYDQLGSFLVVSICGITLIALYTDDEDAEQPSIKSILKRVLGFPPFISLLVSLFLPIEGLTQQISPVLDGLSLTILPIALLVVGLHFRFAVDLADVKVMGGIGIAKLLLIPGLVYLSLAWTALPLDLFAPVLLQSAMPSMITPALFLISAGIAPRLVATSLGYLTLIGCATVYGWSLLI